jgi:hypothetical protein
MNAAPLPPDRQKLTAQLAELRVPPDEVDQSVDVLLRLAAWSAPEPSPASSAQLVQRLIPYLTASSPVREALQLPPPPLAVTVRRFAALCLSQAAIFRLSFWVLPPVVTALAVLAVAVVGVPATVASSIAGPVLGSLGVVLAVRGSPLRPLECELACPPSALQLGAARMLVILGYDGVLAALASGFIWLASGASLVALVVQNVAPFLLVCGVTSLLATRLAANQAAPVAFAAWLVLLAQRAVLLSASLVLPFGQATSLGFAAVGLALLVVAVLASPALARASLHGTAGS